MNEADPEGIKEVFHRVKNNLQVISSLMELQLMESDNLQAQAALREAISRMQVFVIIYQQLLPEENFAAVDYGKVVTEIWHARAGTEDGTFRLADFRNKIETLPIHIETAIPLALILNELITLSKQDNTEYPNRQIEIDCLASGNGSCQLFYADNLLTPERNDAFLKGDEAFGLRLISGLSKQIGGNAVFPAGQETRFVISFAPRKKLVKQ